MRNLEAELNDLARFEQTFHLSCETGFGVESLREYLMEQALERRRLAARSHHAALARPPKKRLSGTMLRLRPAQQARITCQ